MPIEHRVGDLFTADVPAIAHGCNAKGKMGSGIAVEFRRRWPEMYNEYADLCAQGDLIGGHVFIWKAEPIVFNLVTQTNPGPNASLDYIRIATEVMVIDAWERFGITSIGLPRIGAGIGGLAWDEVEAALDASIRRAMATLRDTKAGVPAEEPTLYVYTLEAEQEKFAYARF